MNKTMEDKKVAAAVVAGVRLRRRNSVPSSVKIPRKFTLSTTKTTNHSHQTTPPIESIPNGNHHHSITSTTDCELIPLKYPSYTSLRDLLPPCPSVLSPSNAASVLFTGAASSSTSSSGGSISAATANTCSGNEISIRNRLVKQAAWAYLQPMSSSPSSSGRRLWSWSRWWYLCVDSFKQFFVSVNRYIVEMMTSVSGWLADALWLIFCR